MGLPLFVRPRYALRNRGDAVCGWSSRRFRICLLEGLGVRHEVVGALSALEANDPY